MGSEAETVQVRSMTQNPMQRFDMEPEDIDRLMRAFYNRIRVHDVLGPIFNRAVGEDDDVWRVQVEQVKDAHRRGPGGPAHDLLSNGIALPCGGNDGGPADRLWGTLGHPLARGCGHGGSRGQ